MLSASSLPMASRTTSKLFGRTHGAPHDWNPDYLRPPAPPEMQASVPGHSVRFVPTWNRPFHPLILQGKRQPCPAALQAGSAVPRGLKSTPAILSGGAEPTAIARRLHPLQ